MSRKTEVFTVSLPPGMKDRIKELAEKEGRNVSNMTVMLLEYALKNKAV
jgi:predicted DNA-binding protein